MDSLNAYYPNTIKYIDNDFDSSSKLDSAFPGKIIFKSKCLSPNPNNINNIEKFTKSTNLSNLSSNKIEKYNNKESIGKLNGEYNVSYRGKLRQGVKMDINDRKARQSNNLGNTIFDEVIQINDVKNKCTEKRDQDKTFYIENTYGKGKYECLKKDGNNIIGNHYLPNKTFWGIVKYTSLNSFPIKNFKDLGPYIDKGQRALRYGPHKYGYTPKTCYEATKGYKYFALQNNGWCSADNDYNHVTKYGESNECKYGEKGIRNGGKLGGPWCNYVFEKIDCELDLNKLNQEYNTLYQENNKLRNDLNNDDIKSQLNKKLLEKTKLDFKKKIYDDNNQMKDNANIENFDNSNSIEDLIKYNQGLIDKQQVQKDKIELIKQKEENLNKVSASLKSSNDRNNFKRKVIYTLVALIFFLFILSLSTYIYFVRDFKPSK